MVVRTGIKEVMCAKDIVREESIGDEKRERVWTMGEERIEVIEGTKSDIGIVSEIREGDREMKIMESTKIGEGREKGEGSGEEMKRREAEITGEECGRVTMGSSAWSLLSSGILSASASLAFGFSLLFLFLVFRLSLLIERLILRWSDCCCYQRA